MDIERCQQGLTPGTRCFRGLCAPCHAPLLLAAFLAFGTPLALGASDGFVTEFERPASLRVKPAASDEGVVVAAISVAANRPLAEDSLRIERVDGGSSLLSILSGQAFSRSTVVYQGRVKAGRYRIHSLFNSRVATGVGGGLGFLIANQEMSAGFEFEVRPGEILDIGSFITHAPMANNTAWKPNLVPAGFDEAVDTFVRWAWPEFSNLAARKVQQPEVPGQSYVDSLRANAPLGATIQLLQGGGALLVGPLGGVHRIQPDGRFISSDVGSMLGLYGGHTRGAHTLLAGEFGSLFVQEDDSTTRRLKGLPESTVTVRAAWMDSMGAVHAVIGEGLQYASTGEQMTVTELEDPWLLRPAQVSVLRCESLARCEWRRSWQRPWPMTGLRVIPLETALVVFHPDGTTLVVSDTGEYREIPVGTERLSAGSPSTLVAWDGSSARVGRARVSDDLGQTWREVGTGDRKAALMSRVLPPVQPASGVDVVLGRTRVRAGTQDYRRALFVSRDSGATFTEFAQLPRWCWSPLAMTARDGSIWLTCMDGSVLSVAPDSGQVTARRSATVVMKGAPPPP